MTRRLANRPPTRTNRATFSWERYNRQALRSASSGLPLGLSILSRPNNEAAPLESSILRFVILPGLYLLAPAFRPDRLKELIRGTRRLEQKTQNVRQHQVWHMGLKLHLHSRGWSETALRPPR